MESELLSREDAARYLGVRPGTLAVWASTHRYGLRFFKIGKLARYRRADLENFVQARAVEPSGVGGGR